MDAFNLTNYAYSVTLSVTLAIVLWVYRVELVTIRDWLLKYTGVNTCRRTINETIYRNIYKGIDVRDGKSFKVKTDVSYTVTGKRRSRIKEAVIMTLFLPIAVIQYIITLLYVTVEHGNSCARQAEKSVERRRVKEVLSKPSNRCYWQLKISKLSASELSTNVDLGDEADCILEYYSDEALTCVVVQTIAEDIINFEEVTKWCEEIIALYGNDADNYKMPREETAYKHVTKLFGIPKTRTHKAKSRIVECIAGKDMSLLLVDKQNGHVYFTSSGEVLNKLWTNGYPVRWNMESLMEYDKKGKIKSRVEHGRYVGVTMRRHDHTKRLGRCRVNTAKDTDEGLKVERCDSVHWLPRNETNDFSENVKLGTPCLISNAIIYDGYNIRVYVDGEACSRTLLPAVAILAGSLSIRKFSEILDRVSGTLNDSDKLRACLYGSVLSRKYGTNVLGDKISWVVALTNAFRFGLTNKPGRAYRQTVDLNNDGGATIYSYTYSESAEILLDGDMYEIAKRNSKKADLMLDINVGGTVRAAECVRTCGQAYTYEAGEEEHVVRLIIKRKNCRVESADFMTYG